MLLQQSPQFLFTLEKKKRKRQENRRMKDVRGRIIKFLATFYYFPYLYAYLHDNKNRKEIAALSLDCCLIARWRCGISRRQRVKLHKWLDDWLTELVAELHIYYRMTFGQFAAHILNVFHKYFNVWEFLRLFHKIYLLKAILSLSIRLTHLKVKYFAYKGSFY